MVVISSPKEGLQCPYTCGDWPFRNSSNLGRVRADTSSGDNVAQKPESRTHKVTFGAFELKLLLTQPSKYTTKVTKVLGSTFTTNNEVVKINASAVLQTSESFLHNTLKGTRGIGKPHRHDNPFKLSLAADKCTLTGCILSHTHLMKARL